MKAWQIEKKRMEEALPPDFTQEPSDWSEAGDIGAGRRKLLSMFWESRVPGSRAPESLYTAMVQAWHNRGYDVSASEALLPEAEKLFRENRLTELEELSGEILRRLWASPRDPAHIYWNFRAPSAWADIAAAFPASRKEETELPEYKEDPAAYRRRIQEGWLGQIAGGSYGTALEGYTGSTLKRCYGDQLDGYIKPPETFNDDVTYEIAFLKALEAIDRDATAPTQPAAPDQLAEGIGRAWLRYIPFGWSAEYFALENLRRGLFPPESGIRENPFSEWIGAQMRTMGCGLVTPGDPAGAARLAYLDSIVSHEKNGVYGGIHSAVLTSLAFVISDPRELVKRSRDYIPDGTLFAHYFDRTVDLAEKARSAGEVWETLEQELLVYNWIHTIPNMVAVVLGLWFGGGDFTRTFRILAECGLDVDCNAGEAGTALGVIQSLPEKWAAPLDDQLETYIPGMERLKISELAAWTAGLRVSKGRF